MFKPTIYRVGPTRVGKNLNIHVPKVVLDDLDRRDLSRSQVPKRAREVHSCCHDLSPAASRLQAYASIDLCKHMSWILSPSLLLKMDRNSRNTIPLLFYYRKKDRRHCSHSLGAKGCRECMRRISKRHRTKRKEERPVKKTLPGITVNDSHSSSLIIISQV